MEVELIPVGKQSHATVIPEEEAMVVSFCSHSHHWHWDQEKTLPFLWASLGEGFDVPVVVRHWGSLI